MNSIPTVDDWQSPNKCTCRGTFSIGYYSTLFWHIYIYMVTCVQADTYSMYGVDWEGPLPLEENDPDTVGILAISLDLSNVILVPLWHEFGIHLYFVHLYCLHAVFIRTIRQDNVITSGETRHLIQLVIRQSNMHIYCVHAACTVTIHQNPSLERSESTIMSLNMGVDQCQKYSKIYIDYCHLWYHIHMYFSAMWTSSYMIHN